MHLGTLHQLLVVHLIRMWTTFSCTSRSANGSRPANKYHAQTPKATGPDGYESDDAAYEVQEDGEVAVYIGEDFDEVKEGEVEQDGVEEPATSTRKRKTQTEKEPAKKTQTYKPPAKKAPTRKKPSNMPKPLTPTKKPRTIQEVVLTVLKVDIFKMSTFKELRNVYDWEGSDFSSHVGVFV